jgi:hypothetical protein
MEATRKPWFLMTYGSLPTALNRGNKPSAAIRHGGSPVNRTLKVMPVEAMWKQSESSVENQGLVSQMEARWFKYRERGSRMSG